MVNSCCIPKVHFSTGGWKRRPGLPASNRDPLQSSQSLHHFPLLLLPHPSPTLSSINPTHQYHQIRFFFAENRILNTDPRQKKLISTTEDRSRKATLRRFSSLFQSSSCPACLPTSSARLVSTARVKGMDSPPCGPPPLASSPPWPNRRSPNTLHCPLPLTFLHAPLSSPPCLALSQMPSTDNTHRGNKHSCPAPIAEH